MFCRPTCAQQVRNLKNAHCCLFVYFRTGSPQPGKRTLIVACLYLYTGGPQPEKRTLLPILCFARAPGGRSATWKRMHCCMLSIDPQLGKRTLLHVLYLCIAGPQPKTHITAFLYNYVLKYAWEVRNLENVHYQIVACFVLTAIIHERSATWKMHISAYFVLVHSRFTTLL